MPATKEKEVDNRADKSLTEKATTSIGQHASIEDFTKAGLNDIVQATKTVNSFPQGAARDLYCAYPVFGKIIDQQSERILGLISKVLKWQNIKGNIQRRQPDEQFEMLLECNDAILERVGLNLDEMSGVKKVQMPELLESRISYSNAVLPNDSVGKGAGSWNVQKNNTTNIKARLLTAKNISRPQLKFSVPVDNSANTPFIPKLQDKPNSLKPLAILPEYDEAGNIESYLHPYEFELMKFEVSDDQLQRKSPTKPVDLQELAYAYVDTVPKLQAALAEMREYKELAIDLEHHSYRTFLGFTCLLQVSTRGKDYLFDTLTLRENLHVLNELFTNPKVVKIFHGADMDIEWLQRDLSLYVVNMFDTHQAAKVLNFARLSLAFLLKHYCNIDADKTLQLADWRIRPLPEELVTYARQDTHYLIYIYECMNNDLLDASNQQTNLLRAIYQRSTEICMKRYHKPSMNADSHVDFYRRSKRTFDNRQLYALREIYQWRDKIARLEDESFGFVLPNHMLLQIAEALPREMQGILACCKPIPPLVRQHLHVLHHIVLRAREQPLVKPVVETSEMNRVNNPDLQNKLQCPHDSSHDEEFRDDLPTLLNFRQADNLPLAVKNSYNDVDTKMDEKPLCKRKPVLSIFENEEDDTENEDDDDDGDKVSKDHTSKFQRMEKISQVNAIEIK